MKKYCLLLLILNSYFYFYANSIIIEFPEFSTTSIGISPLHPDPDFMLNYSKEQASVLYSRLQNSYNFYELMIIDYYTQKNTKNFTTNIDDLYHNFDNLQLLHIHPFAGYNIFFFDLDNAQLPHIRENTDIQIEKLPTINVENSSIIVAATAEALKLDESLDKAFELALMEMSKTTNLTAVSIIEANYYYATHDVLVKSENLLSNIRLSKIIIKQNTDKNYFYYTVRIELIKDDYR